MAGQTPSQTVGPFFAYSLTPDLYRYAYRSAVGDRLVQSGTEGQRIRIEGRVLDGNGEPIPDAMIELWQANAHGRYNHPADDRADNLLDPDFRGFARTGTGTGPECRFVFETVKPGALGDGQAPHLNLIVLMRGLLSHLYTRIYFADETDGQCRRPGARPGAAGPAPHADRAARRSAGRRRLSLRHPHAGAGRDGLLRRLSQGARRWRSC